MNPKYLTSQEGMETVLNKFCNNWPEDQVGRVNELCRPEFVACSFEDKTLCLKYFVQDWMRNYADVMHGGVITTVFDLTMGLLSCYCSGGLLTPTTNIQVNFLRPVPAGGTLFVKASCDMAGSTFCAVSAKAWMETKPEKVTATASASFYTGNGAKQAVSLFDRRE